MRATLLCMIVAVAPLAGQSRGQVKRTIDAFTQDTIWRTNYGRLDEAKGCARDQLALIFEVQRGKVMNRARLMYQYSDMPGPFSHASQLNANSAAFNIDSRIVQLVADSTRAQPHSFLDSPGQFNENGGFVLPDSMLLWLDAATAPRLRIVGADKTCDGILEHNIHERIKELLQLTRFGSSSSQEPTAHSPPRTYE